MSTMVEMPVRVKPPPAETGETISPGWASLEIATPANGARMIVSSSSWREDGGAAARHLDVAAAAARRRASRLSACAWAVSSADCEATPPAVSSRLRSRSFCARVRLASVSASAFSAALELRLGELELEPRLAVVEPGQDLALLDLHPLFDEDLGDLAGDLRRDGRLRAAP